MPAELCLQFRCILKSKATFFLLGEDFKVLFTGDCCGWVGSCSLGVWSSDANQVDVAWEEVQRQFEVLGLGRKDEHRRIQSSVAYSSLIPVLPGCREPWVLADQVNWCQYTAAAVPVLKSKLNSHFFLKSSLLVNCCPLPARAVLEVWLICHKRFLKGHFVAWLAGQSLQDHCNYKVPISFYLFIYLLIYR